MGLYQSITLMHVVFTILAFAAGLLAYTLGPKGGPFHKKMGVCYVYLYLGVVFTGYVMVGLRFKLFFLGLTLFGSYLVLTAYLLMIKGRTKTLKNLWLKVLLSLTVIVHLVDLIFALYNAKSLGLEWLSVRVVYALIPLGVLVLTLSPSLETRRLHATLMILTLIPLFNGALARLSPQEYVWLFWLLGYLLFVPLLAWWLLSTKSRLEA